MIRINATKDGNQIFKTRRTKNEAINNYVNTQD